MSKWVLAVWILIASPALGITLQQDEWKEYPYPQDGFAISAPVQPQFQRKTGSLHEYSAKTDNGSHLLVLVINDDAQTPQEGLDRAKRILFSSGATKPIPGTEKTISLGNYPGIQAQAKDNHLLRIFEVDGRLFILLTPISSSGDRFFNSFRLVTPEWKEYVFADLGFAISSTAEPVLQGGASQNSGTTAYSIDLPHHYGYFISVADVPSTDSKWLKEMKDKAIARLKGNITAEKEVSLEGHPGIAVEVQAEKNHYHGRFYLANEKLYMLMAKGNLNVEEIEHFFNSFRLVKH